jgi:hypothetical protein
MMLVVSIPDTVMLSRSIQTAADTTALKPAGLFRT